MKVAMWTDEGRVGLVAVEMDGSQPVGTTTLVMGDGNGGRYEQRFTRRWFVWTSGGVLVHQAWYFVAEGSTELASDAGEWREVVEMVEAGVVSPSEVLGYLRRDR